MNCTYSFKNKQDVNLNAIRKIDTIVKENEYELSFDFNCRLEEWLKVEQAQTINLKIYLCGSETYFTINGITDIGPKIQIAINQYLKNRFVILIYFYTNDCSSNHYSEIIEFDFNIDDYL